MAVGRRLARRAAEAKSPALMPLGASAGLDSCSPSGPSSRLSQRVAIPLPLVTRQRPALTLSPLAGGAVKRRAFLFA